MVKLSNEEGKVVATAAKVTEVAEKTLTITTKETPTVKAGDSVSLQKGRVMTGC